MAFTRCYENDVISRTCKRRALFVNDARIGRRMYGSQMRGFGPPSCLRGFRLYNDTWCFRYTTVAPMRPLGPISR